MIPYRPLARVPAWSLAQATASIPVVPPAEASLKSIVDLSNQRKTLALVASGVGMLGSAAGAYGHYNRAGGKLNTWSAILLASGAISAAIFGAVLLEK